jgi:hypothetical protein
MIHSAASPTFAQSADRSMAISYLKVFEHFQGSLEQFLLSANAKSLGRTRGILADAAGKQA